MVALIGPRQCGKTTLARLEQPMTALRDLRGLVVIGEVQRRPDLFPILRVLADRMPLTARFLILGSASPELLRQSSGGRSGSAESALVCELGQKTGEVTKSVGYLPGHPSISDR